MANSFINKKADLTTTDLTTLYTVPAARTAVVKSLLVSNDSGSSCNIDVTLVDASSNIFSLFKTKAVGYQYYNRAVNTASCGARKRNIKSTSIRC